MLWGWRAQPQLVARTAQTDLDQMVQQAQTIVRGHVVSAKIEPHPQFPNLQTVVITLSVSKVLKGEVGPKLTFRQFHADADDQSVFARYKGLGEVLLFLNPVSQYGLTSPVGLEQGRFRVLHDGKGNRYVLNGRNNIGLFSQVAAKAANRGITLSSRAIAMLSKSSGRAPLDIFEETIQKLAGRT
jgi:hypothetical protein